MFRRPHHQIIALVLHALDGALLRENACLFGGGTAIALRYGEFRESVDIDFLVSRVSCFRNLRQLLTAPAGLNALVRPDAAPMSTPRGIRADQYGIRTLLSIADQPIKFEIVLEARIELDQPGPADEVCGIATLTPVDMVATKLLANSDRWSDPSVFSRDLIDLAMMAPPLELLGRAIGKAETAYGDTIIRDLKKAVDRVRTRQDLLDQCIESLRVSEPRALVWQRIRNLSRDIAGVTPGN